MKGTRPRGRWTDEDDALRAELAGSAKDRAENLMIVDLLRNDLGRVCEYGSVVVPSLFEVERYPTVHQMTSSIVGSLREDASLTDIFRSLFPSGSVTGAPKVRTCQIIREVESTARGPYTGAIGFVSPTEAVFSVAIRTALIDHRTGTLELGVGSGITADSSPESEYQECLSKGAFLRFSRPDFELLESLRLELPGGYRRLENHLDRMEASAGYFGIPFDRDAVRGVATTLAEAQQPGVYKVRVLLGQEGAARATVEAIPEEMPPARVAIARNPVNSRDSFLYHKTTNRSVYDEGLAAFPGLDDVIFLNERGEVTESSRGNVVIEVDGSLLTPPVVCGLLPGIFRAELLRGGQIREGVVTMDEVNHATRLYIINSVRGWRLATLE